MKDKDLIAELKEKIRQAYYINLDVDAGDEAVNELIRLGLHQIQIAILELSETTDLSKLSLRQIGEMIGVPHPQKIKHHINQLKSKHLL